MQRNRMMGPLKSDANYVLIDLTKLDDERDCRSPITLPPTSSASASEMNAAASLLALVSPIKSQDVDIGDDGSTDLRLATLALLFPDVDMAALLDLLALAGGSVEEVSRMLSANHTNQGRKRASDASSTSQEGRSIRPRSQAPGPPLRQRSTSRMYRSPEPPLR